MILERQEVIQYVLAQLKEKRIDLTEHERFVLIGKAYAAAKQGESIMAATVIWELTLLLEREGATSTVYFTKGRYIPFRTALESFLSVMRLPLYYSNKRESYFVALPKGIARNDFLQRLKRIMRTGNAI